MYIFIHTGLKSLHAIRNFIIWISDMDSNMLKIFPFFGFVLLFISGKLSLCQREETYFYCYYSIFLMNQAPWCWGVLRKWHLTRSSFLNVWLSNMTSNDNINNDNINNNKRHHIQAGETDLQWATRRNGSLRPLTCSLLGISPVLNRLLQSSHLSLVSVPPGFPPERRTGPCAAYTSPNYRHAQRVAFVPNKPPLLN